MKHLASVILFLLTTITARAAEIEPWADPAMSVKDGVALWLDATRQSAAAKANGKQLTDGDALETWYDGSGHRRDLTQPVDGARPHFTPAAVTFDGKDDHLLRDDEAAPALREFTAVLVVTPRANDGGFRAFLSTSATGKSDFRTGINLDMGPMASDASSGFDDFNVEGSGFGAAVNLFEQTAAPFGRPQALLVSGGAPGKEAIKAYLHGEPTGHRARADAPPIATQRLVLGARSYTLNANPPIIGSFLDGDVIEVLLFDRVLDDAERAKLNEYLVNKHPALAASALAAAESAHAGTAPIQRVKDPPAVQVFVPGFSARELPLDLTNINNLRYREDGKLVAMAYNGNVFLLTDTDGDGLEDKADLF
ncbi:MAG: hypothetical protein WBD40_09545, partial [Tepidisphaeraceae bacterium]